MAPVRVPPTSKKIHLTRHAQAEHNVAYDYTIPDAPLTALGREQSKNLHSMTKDNIQQTADLLVSSVMRRPMETMLIGYADLQKRLEKEGKPPIILDTLQEVNHHACDTPTAPIEKLKESNGGMFAQLDFSGISPDYASKKGIFDPANVQQRAREVRVWLRERPEGEIVVVAHGDILRNIIDGHNSSRDYLNAEVKSFTFQSNDDYDAKLIEISEVAPEKATDEPTSSEMK